MCVQIAACRALVSAPGGCDDGDTDFKDRHALALAYHKLNDVRGVLLDFMEPHAAKPTTGTSIVTNH